MKNNIIITIHGVNSEFLDSAKIHKFNNTIKKLLPENKQAHNIFKVFNWDIIVGERQLDAMEMEEGLPRQRMLRLKHTVWSDVFWDCQTTARPVEKTMYNEIYQKLSNEIDELLTLYGMDSNIVIIGHSWGGQRALSYCYNGKHKIKGIFTMGAPITAVSGKFTDWGKVPPIDFWVNFRMRYDWVGSQFNLHKSKDIRNFVQDVHINKWWSPKCWTIFGAHSAYWTHKTVHKAIADILDQLD